MHIRIKKEQPEHLIMNTSFWEDALLSETYDLIVVGAGITGQSAAYFFKKQHPAAKVLVVEQGAYPSGASTRNAGFACIGTVGESLVDLGLESEEKVKKRMLARYHGLNLLRSELGEDYIDFEASGGWEIFTDRQHFEKSAAHIARVNRWLEDETGIKEVFEASGYQNYPAIFNKVDGALHPGKMMRRLHRLNVERGVEFRWNSPVKTTDADVGMLRLEDGSSLKAEKLILATNAFTNLLSQENVIIPGRGYVFVTEPLPELSWKGTFHYNEGFIYYRNLGTDRMLVGGGRNKDMEVESTTEFGINPKIKEYMIDFADTVLRLPAGWKIEREWSGIMGFTATKTPFLEKTGERCLLAGGLSGMGVALGMQLGKDASEKIHNL